MITARFTSKWPCDFARRYIMGLLLRQFSIFYCQRKCVSKIKSFRKSAGHFLTGFAVAYSVQFNSFFRLPILKSVV